MNTETRFKVRGWNDTDSREFWVDSNGWIGVESSEEPFAKIDFEKVSDRSFSLLTYNDRTVEGPTENIKIFR
jgi:hypothetical protein